MKNIRTLFVFCFFSFSLAANGLNTPNRLGVEFSTDRVRLSQWDATTKKATGSLFFLNLAAFGRQGALREMAKTKPELRDVRVKCSRTDITAWYCNSGKSFKQSLNIPVRLNGEGELCVLLEADAAVDRAGENAVRLLVGGHKADLVAIDANGRKLGARLDAHSGRSIGIYVADRAATYPIVIDPTLDDESWVSGFDAQGMDEQIDALAFDSKGNLSAGGCFTTAGDVTANGIAKWNGSKWSALGPGMDDQVNALAFDSNGNLYAGGDFIATEDGSVTVNYIAKWDGTAWTVLGSGVDDNVYALACDSAEDLYVGGDFNYAGGKPSSNIAEYLSGGGSGTFVSNTDIDTDGNGFPDELKTALGISLTDPNATPLGIPTGTPPLPLTISKLGVKLNFACANSDSISLSGTLPIPAGLVVAGQSVVIDVGGVIRIFTLDDMGKGTASSGIGAAAVGGPNDYLKLRVKSLKGVIAAQTAPFTVKLNKGAFVSLLSDEGLVKTATVKNSSITVPVIILFNVQVFEATHSVFYTAKKGKP